MEQLRTITEKFAKSFSQAVWLAQVCLELDLPAFFLLVPLDVYNVCLPLQKPATQILKLFVLRRCGKFCLGGFLFPCSQLISVLHSQVSRRNCKVYYLFHLFIFGFFCGSLLISCSLFCLFFMQAFGSVFNLIQSSTSIAPFHSVQKYQPTAHQLLAS